MTCADSYNEPARLEAERDFDALSGHGSGLGPQLSLAFDSGRDESLFVPHSSVTSSEYSVSAIRFPAIRQVQGLWGDADIRYRGYYLRRVPK
jgi:hypothetical protein